MSEKFKCGGYIYKWGSKVGCTDYTIPEEVFKKGAPEERVYPVTDGNFLVDDPFSVLGTAKVKFDEKGAWADIVIISEPAKDAIMHQSEGKLTIEEKPLKLGFMINRVKKDEQQKTIVRGDLRAIDISEVGIHDIEYVSFYRKENGDAGSVQNLPESEPAL